uniref:PD-(D/E)XK endonuclease-like domain-containing protein n=1 Tax=viral metagenome TaxID=1070528 RepID=A0A6M3L6G4_9ZZZZ
MKCPKCGAEGIPFELKDTDMSSTKPVTDSPHFLRQIMCQCKVTGTTSAILSRLHNQGNRKWLYRPKDPVKIQALVDEYGEDWAAHPTLEVYKVEFTQAEIDENWKQMVARRDLYSKIHGTGKLLPKPLALMSGSEWECGWCPYQERCEGA